MLCILAGLTSISLRRFTLIMVLTRPWGLLFSCALGGSTITMPLWAMVPIALAGLGLFLAGLRWGDALEEAVLRRFRNRKNSR